MSLLYMQSLEQKQDNIKNLTAEKASIDPNIFVLNITLCTAVFGGRDKSF